MINSMFFIAIALIRLFLVLVTFAYGIYFINVVYETIGWSSASLDRFFDWFKNKGVVYIAILSIASLVNGACLMFYISYVMGY